MIIRFVKMTFRPGKENDFLELFNSSKEKIRDFEGCSHLELLRDIKHPNVFFTLSHWESENHLEAYRRSGLFNTVWGKASALFLQKAEAWSTEKS
ncbi:MAG TPA: antibiotic biosynthesis monooxygenase family protein [Bacteroidia bacterium]